VPGLTLPHTLAGPSEVRPHLWADVRVVAEGESTVISCPRGRLALQRPTPAQAQLLRHLAGGAATEQQLSTALGRDEGPAGVAWLYLLLARLAERGMLGHALTAGGTPFARLQPFSRNYQATLRSLPSDRPLQLCRFAYVRRVDAELVLESPRSHARVFLDDPGAAGLLAWLASPRMAADAAAQPLPGGLAEAFLQMLFRNGFLADGGGEGDAESRAEAQWEFHDLLFHGRSRAGRALYPWGATYRWEGVHEPLPAVKVHPGPGLPLERPELARLKESDPPLAAVMESRRSLRSPGPAPLTRVQLAEFLFRTARVRGRTRTEHEEVSNRPYPGGGADYELEIYPVVHRVDGVEPGIYHYDPLGHALHPVAGAGPQQIALLREAAQKARLQALPDVLLCMTARFQRLTYKYSSIAYAVMLKDLGALYQTFYLAATAMDLAPCAIGSGDADRFAKATGFSELIEPSVGEFMLSAPDPNEGQGPRLPEVPEGS
jgi:SagB-type dehydrogenase family enzyme